MLAEWRHVSIEVVSASEEGEHEISVPSAMANRRSRRDVEFEVNGGMDE